MTAQRTAPARAEMDGAPVSLAPARVSGFSQIPLTEWSDENPAKGTSFWAANVVATVVAFQAC